MTALFAFLLSATLLSVSPNGKEAVHRVSETHQVTENVNFMPDFTDSTFSVQNLTSVDAGWVTIYLADSTNCYINVTGEGLFYTTLTNYPYECSLHGHSFGEGIPTRIIIDAHTSVRVTWTSSVIVIYQGETM